MCGNHTNECQTQVNDARNSDIPNIEQWIEEAKNTVTQIHENCGRFIEKSEHWMSYTRSPTNQT